MFSLEHGFKRSESKATLYVKKQDGVFPCQKKYVVDLVKKFNMSDGEKALTTINYDMWYSNLCNFNFVGWTCSEWT